MSYSGDKAGCDGQSYIEPAVRVAVGQMTSVGDQDANFNVCSQLAREAAHKGCKMLFLPECFSFIGVNQKEASVIDIMYIDILYILLHPVTSLVRTLIA